MPNGVGSRAGGSVGADIPVCLVWAEGNVCPTDATWTNIASLPFVWDDLDVPVAPRALRFGTPLPWTFEREPPAMSTFGSASRRRFMKSAAALSAVVGLPEWFLQREMAMAAETAATTPAPTTQPKLPVALIGCGGRGMEDAGVAG